MDDVCYVAFIMLALRVMLVIFFTSCLFMFVMFVMLVIFVMLVHVCHVCHACHICHVCHDNFYARFLNNVCTCLPCQWSML